MQTIMAVNDPSFDLSAIVEVEEVSDVISQHGSERLELKFDTALDLQDIQDDLRMPATSTAIWWVKIEDLVNTCVLNGLDVNLEESTEVVFKWSPSIVFPEN